VGDRYVRIERPRDGETFGSPAIDISGVATPSSRVRIRVYGASSKLVSDQMVWSAAGGRWSDAARVPAVGNYRADAELLSTNGNVLAKQSVSFRYGSGGSGGRGSLWFTRPTEGQTINTSPVVIAGRAIARSDLHLQVNDSRGNRVHYEMTRVDGGGEWSARVNLATDGTHRAIAELLADNGKVLQRATLSFRYGRWGGGSGGGGPAWLVVDTPKEGQRLYNVVYGFSGKANPGHDVRIQVYDARGKRVFGFASRVAGDGGWYLTVRIPGSGRYRAQIESMDRNGVVCAARQVHFVYGSY
jgi:hypothetical protein